ncbi:MAG TPA: Uma2 family endonuclease, partial [Thermoanaerobaculia bacterium]|nr:Uma2 family endonuclease [Thermoanaerobaculia bacterium]
MPALLEELPLAATAELGPFRRRDYLALPDEPRCELLYGSLYVSPSPSSLHQVVVTLLWDALNRTTESSRGLALVAPLDVALSDHSVVQPDVIYVSRERRSIVGERIEGAPDLLVEVRSPGTARRDRVQKLKLYAESGVAEYWIVDPEEKEIDFLVNEAGRFVVVIPDGEVYRSAVLAGVELDIPAFWNRVALKLS